MEIVYVTTARIPSERAHAIQIVKTCEALGKKAAVTLIAPRRRDRAGDDPFAYHHLQRTFSFMYLATFDTVRYGKIGFWFHQVFFGLHSAWYLYRKKWSGVVYGRDEALLWIVRRCGFSVVWESHQGKLNWFVRHLIAKKTPIVVISEGIYTQYQHQGVPAERMIVAHDGVDVSATVSDISKDDARLALGLPIEISIAMYIGSLDEWKGWRTFAAAAAHMPDITAVIIGGSPAQVSAARQEYPLVHFLGHRPYHELAQNQRAADVLVIPNTATNKLSAAFTSPLKVFAHMASGVPIVASDVPSIREILSPDTAILVVPDNPDALIAGIQKALTKQDVQKVITAASEVTQYTWDARAVSIVAFLKRIFH